MIKTKLLNKIDQILRTFTPFEPAWTATMLAKKLDLPLTTMHGILSDLVALDFLTQSPLSKAYAIGPRYMEMGFQYNSTSDLNNLAHGVMQNLALRQKEVIGLSVLYKGWMYVPMTVLPASSARGLKYQGPRLPAHMSAGGLTILADLPEEAIDRYCAMDWSADKSAAPFTKLELSEKIRRIRQKGYALHWQQTLANRPSVIAAPIYGHQQKVIAGLVVVGPHEGFLEEEVLRVSTDLIACAREISTHCGSIIQADNYI